MQLSTEIRSQLENRRVPEDIKDAILSGIITVDNLECAGITMDESVIYDHVRKEISKRREKLAQTISK